MDTIMRIETIGDMFRYISDKKPKHPLIGLVHFCDLPSFDAFHEKKVVYGFYTISLKMGQGCELGYGRRKYDFEEGSLVFTAPGQVISIKPRLGLPITEGWMLVFHPDLIRGSALEAHMSDYNFFDYESNEALHLSEDERAVINGLADNIEKEASMNLDIYSKRLLISNLEVLLNYADRFYGKQFITRAAENNEVAAKFEKILNERLTPENIEVHGVPTVLDLADQMGYSTYYLSDLLKKETGRNTKDHIHHFLMEQAKNMLLGTNKTISEISYILRFEQPAYFSRLFKNKNGMSPAAYRKAL